MKKIIFAILFIYPLISVAQIDNGNEKLNNTLDKLLELIHNGDVKAMYDLSGFLKDDQPFVRKQGEGTNTTNLRDVSLSILYYNTDFKNLQITDSLSASQFRKFLLDNESKIGFSPFLSRFTNVPLDQREVEYQLRRINKEEDKPTDLNDLKIDIEECVIDKRYYSIVERLEEVGKLKTKEAFQFLKECSQGKHWGKGKNDRETQIYSGICYSLRHFETIESAKIIVDIINNHDVYSLDECIIALSKITNVDLVVNNQSYENIATNYKQLLDSLTTINQLKEAGYNMMFEYGPNYFENPTEYYGKMMLESDQIWWINYHTLQDIFRTNDPLALKYVGSQLNRGVTIYNDHLGRSEYDIVELMQDKTGVKVEVKDNTGNWTSTYNDDLSKINYLIYWYNHYSDYKWNSAKEQFENQTDKILEPDKITSLFEKLFNEDDEIAMNAYVQLAQSEPKEVKEKIHQYRIQKISGKLNRSLPMFAKKFLLQLVDLTDYCRKNSINFEPSLELISKLETIENNDEFGKRYELENGMIEWLKIKDVVPLEYYTIINNENVDDLPISRILDKWYSENWNQIIDSPEELRSYLKRAWLYDHLGIIGNVNKYILKFNNSTKNTLDKLQALADSTDDEDIKTMALKALNHKSNNAGQSVSNTKRGILLKEFLDNLDNQSNEVIELVHVDSTDENYELIFNRLKNANSENANKLCYLIANNIHIKMTPFLIRSIEVSTIIDKGYISRHDSSMNQHSINYEILVSDKMVAYLEFLHGHVYPAPIDPEIDANFVSSSRSSNSNFRGKHKSAKNWMNLYKETNGEYTSWGRDFYLKQVILLNSQDTIEIKDINKSIQSIYYQEQDKENIIKSLAKVVPCQNISYLQEDSLGIETLKYFKACDFNADDVERIVNIFDAVPSEIMLEYIRSQTIKMKPKDAGETYYNLMWNTEFKNFVKEQEISIDYKNEISTSLEAYRDILRDDSFNRKYTEKFLEIIKSLDKSLDDKLKNIVLSKSKGAEEYTNSILKDINYSELGIVLKYYDKLPLEDYAKMRFLADDFGFCLFGDYSSEMIDEFRKNYETMSEVELYTFYLDDTGIMYKQNDKLDMNRIYEILKFDIVDGFAGGGGGRRTVHVYSIIRLLEIHFQQHMGKHKKFNNLINSMGYSASEKAFLWMDFLVEKGHALRIKNDVPSISNLD